MGRRGGAGGGRVFFQVRVSGGRGAGKGAVCSGGGDGGGDGGGERRWMI